MRHSAIRLLTKACLSAFVLASAQAANAITFSFTTSTATWDPQPSPGVNTRAVQLNPTGGAMGILAPFRNFIYQNLASTNTTVGNWRPVNQVNQTMALGPNEQRFDYNFPASSSSTSNPTTYNWTNNLNLIFGSFYLDGTCSFCGSNNAVSLISSTNGSAQYINEFNSTTEGSQNSITSNIYSILFPASGITGTIQYSAFTNVSTQQFNGGTITITTNDPIIPSTTVPGPLPVMGVGAAFGFSRRLRRRLLAGATKSQAA